MPNLSVEDKSHDTGYSLHQKRHQEHNKILKSYNRNSNAVSYTKE